MTSRHRSPVELLSVVRSLLREQAPDLAELDLARAGESGSSNIMFRLGGDWAVRLPRSREYEGDLLKEVRWVPRLATALSTPIPHVRHVGRATVDFPFAWTVQSWLPGSPPGDLDPGAQERLATDLGRFVRELHGIDASGLPVAGDEWGYRCGEPVTDDMDRWADDAIGRLADLYDPASLAEAWRRIRHVPPRSGPPCWVHADLSSENLLVSEDGDLVGVIDFGGLGVGDPAVDLLYAWSLFDAPARETLRKAASADDATWARARAWSFVGPGLLTLVNYRDSLPRRSARLRTMIEAVSSEVGVDLTPDRAGAGQNAPVKRTGRTSTWPGPRPARA